MAKDSKDKKAKKTESKSKVVVKAAPKKVNAPAKHAAAKSAPAKHENKTVAADKKKAESTKKLPAKGVTKQVAKPSGKPVASVSKNAPVKTAKPAEKKPTTKPVPSKSPEPVAKKQSKQESPAKAAVIKSGKTKVEVSKEKTISKAVPMPAAKPPVPSGNGQPKRRLVISYLNLTDELLDQFKKRYPMGYHDFVIKVNAPNDKTFYAVTLDTADASYLVKVDVKIDTLDEDEFTEPNYGEEGEISSNNNEEESFSNSEEDFDNIPDEEE